MDALLSLVGEGVRGIPESRLAHIQPYIQELIQRLEHVPHTWVIWNPMITTIHRTLKEQLEQILKLNSPYLQFAEVFSFSPACTDSHPGGTPSDLVRHLHQTDDWILSSSSANIGPSPVLPFLWRRDYLLMKLRDTHHPLPSALYLPYELTLRTSYCVQSKTRSNQLQLPGHKQRGSQQVKLRMSFLSQQLNGIVPIIEGSRRNELLRTLPPPQCLTNGFLAATSSSQDLLEPTLGSPPSQNQNQNQPSVSILLSVYNMRNSLGWAVRSVLAQNCPDWELLIGDDGSDDGTADLPYLQSDPRIQVHRFTPNRGKAFVLNELLPLARGRYVLELDGDDWLQPAAVALLTAAMDRSPEAAIATGGSFLWQGTRHLGPLWRGTLPYRGHLADAEAALPLVPRLYRAAILREIGGWPIRPGGDGRLFEDIAVCEALLAEHPEPAVIEQPVYHRVLRASSVSQRGATRYPAWIQSQADYKKGGHLG